MAEVKGLAIAKKNPWLLAYTAILPGAIVLRGDGSEPPAK
jgi:hypothetical protein